MIKAAIFDLDHTLYNFMDCHEVATDAVYNYVNAHFGLDRKSYEEKVAWAMRRTEEKIGVLNASTHSRTLRYQTLLEDIGASALEHAYPMCQLYWNTFYERMVLPPVVKQVLCALKAKDIRILIATDMTCDVQMEKIRVLGIAPYIDFLVTSEEAGAEKPDERILDLCVHKAGVGREECVFVGDHPRKDVTGSMDYGMQAVWCRHFDPERFLSYFGIKIGMDTTERIAYRIERYEDCFDEAGQLISLGGLPL
ncbi:MAG: HAD-IA family hydrolase [Lachnospiraceae bacterium]|nr:HAD-IA family hydrolase [Lachnospiraceae bacterium]